MASWGIQYDPSFGGTTPVLKNPINNNNRFRFYRDDNYLGNNAWDGGSYENVTISAPKKEEKKNNTWIWVVLILLVLVIAGYIYYRSKRAGK